MSVCIVPKCTGSNGVPLPRDVKTKSKWLKKLKLKDNVQVNVDSIVCFFHFNSEDVKKVHFDAKKTVSRLKRGAIPVNPRPAPLERQKEVNNEIKKQQLHTTAKEKENVKTVGGCTALEEDSEESEKHPQSEGVLEDFCRACMSKNDLNTNIYDFVDDGKVTIGSVFMLCAYPINVFEDNSLSKKICNKCLDVLKVIHNFRKRCMATNDLLVSSNSTKRKLSDTDEVLLSKKKKNNLNTKAVKIYTNGESCDLEESALDISSSEFEIVYEDVDKPSDVMKLEDSSDSEVYEEVVCTRRQEEDNFDDIERNMEEIHGQNTINSTDGVSTSDTANEATLEEVINTLEENAVITIKKCSVIKKSATAKLNVHSNSNSNPIPIPAIKELTNVSTEIKLPKEVKIRPVEKFQSDFGEFKATYKSTIINDLVFLEADGYLFEFGLLKSNIRHLKCTVPSCLSHAQQKSVGVSFEDTVNVVSPHNHPKPDEHLQTKQMFLCIMRKKMQTDRNLNIRDIYEIACKQDLTFKDVVPLRNVINEICRHQLTYKMSSIHSFEDFYKTIENDCFEKLHFTHNNQQFYQEKFIVEEEESMAVIFGNLDIIHQVSCSQIMYVDASFKIDTYENFKYQLITVLVWIEDSYYPILFALVNRKTQLIFRQIFSYLHDQLAPELRPQEIITDYEANLYYALAETYTDCNIGGSVFYYTQNLYKKICSLNLSRDLETNQYFRNIYHMLLMLPLLPVNTIMDGLNSIEVEARNLKISELVRPLFDHIRVAWMINVTPELFCVHKLENRINENVIAPFKKLRDFLLLSKGKLQKTQVTIIHVIEKLIELEDFLRMTYSKPDKKTFGRDLSSFQKKNVLRAWQFIEDHPKIEINSFFSKVLGYIKCMENQLWIWGFYRFDGDTDDILINASHFSIVNTNDENVETVVSKDMDYLEYVETPDQDINTVVMEAVVDQDGVLQTGNEIIDTETVVVSPSQQFESAFLKYVYQ